MTPKEFEIAQVAFPATKGEIDDFFTSDFLIAASAVSESSFADYKMSGRVKTHVASFLIVPRF